VRPGALSSACSKSGRRRESASQARHGLGAFDSLFESKFRLLENAFAALLAGFVAIKKAAKAAPLGPFDGWGLLADRL